MLLCDCDRDTSVCIDTSLIQINEFHTRYEMVIFVYKLGYYTSFYLSILHTYIICLSINISSIIHEELSDV